MYLHLYLCAGTAYTHAKSTHALSKLMICLPPQPPSSLPFCFGVGKNFLSFSWNLTVIALSK